MTFNQINYFLAVAQSLNFTRAATNMFVTQSTLSRSIMALETELGVTLLERDFHDVRLTPAGEVMYKEMQEIMERINGVIHRVQEMGGKENDRLVIGLLDGQEVEASILMALKILSDRFPQFTVDIKRMPHQELINEIKTNRLDAAETIISADTVLGENISHLLIKEVGNYLVASVNDPIWEQEPSVAAINGRILVSSANSHPGIVSVNKSIAEAGVSPKIKKAPDTQTEQVWLEAGMGVTICNQGQVLYRSAVFRSLRTALLHELPKASIVLIWNTENHTPSLETLCSFIETSAHQSEADNK